MTAVSWVLWAAWMATAGVYWLERRRTRRAFEAGRQTGLSEAATLLTRASEARGITRESAAVFRLAAKYIRQLP